MKSFVAFLTILGTVIGSGFLSGKEIVVFFSRFGLFSFLGIFLAFFLFWGLFRLFLFKGGVAVKRLQESKFANVLNIIICIIVSSAMFAGINDMLQNFNTIVVCVVEGVIILYSISIVFKGQGKLDKANLILVPFMVIVLIIGLSSKLYKGFIPIDFSPLNNLSIFYSCLYVIFNTSNSAIIMAKLSGGLSNKQKARVSFFAAFALSVILLFANIVLLQNSQLFVFDMPLLSIFESWQKVVMQIIILLGCVTTLFSLVYVMSSSIRGLCKNNLVITSCSVFLPFALSFIGFGKIVVTLYPLSSNLGLFLLCDLFLISFFKRAYTKIHSRGKHT